MKFNLKRIANPYTMFGIAWSLSLVLYSFGWTGIFPGVSTLLAVFIISLIVLFFLTGFFYKRIKPTTPCSPLILSYRLLLIINTAIWLVTFLYSGIPIISGIRDEDFGIPLVKNFATSFNCFLSVYFFYLFLTTRKKRFLLYGAWCLSFFILVISRGSIMLSLATMFFLWLNVKTPVLSIKKLAVIISAILMVFYLFGVAGNYRSIKDLATYNSNIDESYNSDIILQIGDASDSFRESIIPNEFFWSYVYIISPLGNLQYNINQGSPPLTIRGMSLLMVNELVFDAISNKINAPLNLVPQFPRLVVDQLTVSTTLAGSYVDAGWFGMVFFMLIFWLFPILYTFLIQKNPLGIIGISTMCSIYFFSIYDNMFILTGLSLQLLYPVILGYGFKLKRTIVNEANVISADLQ